MHIKRLFSRYFWYDIKYAISSYFNPHQKWLTKVIPNTWMDKPELIRNLLFACLVNFVEKDGEDCFEVNDWAWSEEKVELRKKLERAYDIIKVQIPALEQEIEDMWERELKSEESFDVEKWWDSKFEDKQTRIVEGEEITTYRMKPLTEEQRENTQKRLAIEQKIVDLEQEALYIIVENRLCLWT